jgi:hypothetical protein
MIRLLVSFGKWLDARFPEKVIITPSELEQFKKDVQLCKALVPQVDTLVSRLSVVEANAVHKGAVQDLIIAVKMLKDEYVSLKASLGMSRIGDAEIRAMLSGEPINGDNEENG